MEWVIDKQWIVLSPDTASLCRYWSGQPMIFCRQKAVAQMLRGWRHQTWWAYCADHLYGRTIREGVVYYGRAQHLVESHDAPT